MRDSAFNGNLAGTPGTERSGGAIFSTGKLDLTNSTFLNNGVIGDGGAIANDRSGQLNLSNSTLIANAATARGGAIVTNNTQQGSNIRPKSTLLNVTLALNAGIEGGALYSQAPNNGYPQVTVLANTLVADSVSANCSGGAYSSLGHNLDSGNSCGLNASGDKSNANANLDAPGFNGGPLDLLLTMKLLPGSAGIDAGDPQICADQPVGGADQTGRARPQDGDGVGGSACDIGALENEAAVAGFGSTPVDPGPIPFGNATVNTSIDAGFSVFNTGAAPLTVSGGTLSGALAADFSLQTNLPLTINPGDPAQTITLRCTPAASGLRSAGLTLNTNDPSNPSVLFNLTCNGTPTPVAGFAAQPIAPGPISLGKVRLGETASLPLVISESGTAQLQVSAITLGGLNPGDFALNSSADITIANGGGAVTRNINCTPAALGPRSATLTMTTNDPLQPTVSFTLSVPAIRRRNWCLRQPAYRWRLPAAPMASPSAPTVNTFMSATTATA
ncbi:MAG: choice-of-anchor D domain-containing protein [Oscillochloris sp.]|nr:choice-of-anchor D domain-containing protein [Oscillochloris sp.]